MLSTRTNSIDSGSPASWLRSPAAEVWLKFLLALAGLGIAFGAALFSTAYGEAGNAWASVILASVALLTAVFVGLVTVPYLARRVALERLRESFRYEVTKAGILYVLATLVIGIAALNTGNNLLYIVVAAMLAAILVSGILSAMVLRRLELEVRLPEHVFAGQKISGHIVLRNPRRFLPAFSIRIVPASKEKKKKPRKQWRWEKTTFAFPLHRPPERQWVRMRDWKVKRVEPPAMVPGIFEGMIYFPYLPAKADLQADLPLCFVRRGRYRESSFAMATRFPFSFLTKTRDVQLDRDLLVYPPIDASAEILQILPLVRGEWESFVRGHGSDLYRIREYMPEDSARHVDWKASAKSGSLKVREFTREDERKLCIVFDNPLFGVVPEPAYEKAVNLAASLAWHLSSENAQVSFLIPGKTRTASAYEFFTQLAVIEPAHQITAFESPAFANQHLLADLAFGEGAEYRIVITARSPEDFPNDLRRSTYFVFLGERSTSATQKTASPV